MDTPKESTSKTSHQHTMSLGGDTLNGVPIETRRMIDAAVSSTDDPLTPSLTFRVLLLGAIFSAALAFVNVYYWFRSNPITLGIPVVQLLSLPAGWLLSFILPTRQFNTFGFRWSLNPGPFSTKEHVLISVMANASTGVAYALDIIVIRRFWIGNPLTFGSGVLLALTSQLIGYSYSGLFHRFLVEPEAMAWPSTLVNVALFKTLQSTIAPRHANRSTSSDNVDKTQETVASGDETPVEPEQTTWKISRLTLFWIAFTLSFVFYFIPGWFFTTLTMIPILCFIAPNNIYANQLGDGYNGLGMLAFSLDWSTISNTYTGSPLATP
ncbi:hypothetical protein FBU59_007338, partial [Linderina macrospora]